MTSKIATQIPVNILNSKLLFNIFDIAHTAIIGALINICNPIPISISTWVTSLVVLVIKLSIPNFFISPWENLLTFLKIASLNFFEKPADILEAK